MGKIIAVIEDTGERRLPKDGEMYTFEHALRNGEVAKSIYNHPQLAGQFVILNITEAADGVTSSTITLLERVELINLRRFRDSVSEAQNKFAAVRTDEPEKIREEMNRLASRMHLAAMEMRQVLDYRFPSTPDDAAFEKVIADAFKASDSGPSQYGQTKFAEEAIKRQHRIVDAEWPEVEEDLPL